MHSALRIVLILLLACPGFASAAEWDWKNDGSTFTQIDVDAQGNTYLLTATPSVVKLDANGNKQWDQDFYSRIPALSGINSWDVFWSNLSLLAAPDGTVYVGGQYYYLTTNADGGVQYSTPADFTLMFQTDGSELAGPPPAWIQAIFDARVARIFKPRYPLPQEPGEDNYNTSYAAVSFANRRLYLVDYPASPYSTTIVKAFDDSGYIWQRSITPDLLGVTSGYPIWIRAAVVQPQAQGERLLLLGHHRKLATPDGASLPERLFILAVSSTGEISTPVFLDTTALSLPAGQLMSFEGLGLVVDDEANVYLHGLVGIASTEPPIITRYYPYLAALNPDLSLRWEKFNDALAITHGAYLGYPSATFAASARDQGVLIFASLRDASGTLPPQALADAGIMVESFAPDGGSLGQYSVGFADASGKLPSAFLWPPTTPRLLYPVSQGGDVWVPWWHPSQGDQYLTKNPQRDARLQILVRDGLSGRTLQAHGDNLAQVPVLELSVSAKGDDYTIDSLLIRSRGVGEERLAIARARLLIDDTTITEIDNPFTTDSPHQFSFTGLSRTITSGNTEIWRVEYDFRPDLCSYADNDPEPDGLFVAQLTDDAVTLTGNGATADIKPGEGPEIHIQHGSLAIVSGDQQWGEPRQTLPAPLVVELVNQSANSDCDTRVSFIASGDGSQLSPGNPVPIDDTTRKAQATLTLGELAGPYPVEVQLALPTPPLPHGMPLNGGTGPTVPRPDGSSSVPPYHVADTVKFSAYAAGISITGATYPASGRRPFGTFLGQIQVDNTFQAEVYARAIPDKLTLSLGGQTIEGEQTSTTPIPGGSLTRYTITADMGQIGAATALPVTASVGNQQLQTDIPVAAIPLPGWAVKLPQLVQSNPPFTFNPGTETYRIAFSYPTDFIWSDLLDGAIYLFGGKKNQSTLKIDSAAFWNLDTSSRFEGQGSFSGMLLGYNYAATVKTKGGFDERFDFTGGQASLKTSSSFLLPKKSTIIPFTLGGVPLNVSLALSGKGTTTFYGEGVLGRELEIQRLLVGNTTQIKLETAATLGAFKGVASLGLHAQPRPALDLSLLYASGQGLSPRWGGRLDIPLQIVGSLFWNKLSGTLYRTTLGPWSWGSLAAAGKPQQKTSPRLSADTEPGQDFIATGAVAMRASGETVHVRTAWSEQGPEIRARIDDQADILVESAPERWELDPTVTWLDNGRALAAWTSNRADPDLVDLPQILAGQEIRWALWDGTSWSQASDLTNDSYADGLARLAFDGSRAHIVWVRDDDANPSTRGDWSIQAATFSNGSWSEPQTLAPGDAAADYQPAIAARDGRALAVWARDDDGRYFTALEQMENGSGIRYDNTDGYLMLALYENGWNTPVRVPGSDTGFVHSPAVAWFPDGRRALIAWIGLETQTDGNDQATLYGLIWDRVDNSFSTPTPLDDEARELVAFANPNHSVGLLWTRSGQQGQEVRQARYGLDAQGQLQTLQAPTPLTQGGGSQWQLTAAASDDGRLAISWRAEGGAGLVQDILPQGQASLQVLSDQAVDRDGDGELDAVRLQAKAGLPAAGRHRLIASLKNDGDILVSIQGPASETSMGDNTLSLDIPGYLLRQSGWSGALPLRVCLTRESGLVLACADHQGDSYSGEQFEAGLYFDRASYQPDQQQATLTLEAPEANRDDTSLDTVEVRIGSDLTPVAGSLVLTETSPDSGVFTAQLQLNGREATLKTGNPGLIQAVYQAPGGLPLSAHAAWLSPSETSTPSGPGQTPPGGEKGDKTGKKGLFGLALGPLETLLLPALALMLLARRRSGRS